MEYTTQNLEYAVSVFYNGEQQERARAHAWLTAAQRVPEAWNFVWDLLQPDKGTEIQFYAATTLHTKILRCWSELPPESHEELKQKLLQAVCTYSNGPKIVTNRLCISLAAFILQQGTVDLTAILQPLCTEENTALLLEVLTVIPEEYNSMTMGSYLRAKNRAALQLVSPSVLNDMLRILQSVHNDYSTERPSEETVQTWLQAATCACSWLTLGGEDAPDHVAGTLTELMPLCRALLTVVRVLFTWNEAVSDTALDACEASLSAVRAAGGSSHAVRYPAAGLQLAGELAALTAAVTQRDSRPHSINEELLSALVTCCVCICECHARAIVRAAEGGDGAGGTEAHAAAHSMVDVLLCAQAAPGHYPRHETRSNLVFGAWYTLQDEILNVVDSSRTVHEVWKHVFSRLLATLVAKSEANESSLSRDDQELLRCYRQDIADCVMYCYAILGDFCWSTVEQAYLAADTLDRREATLHIFLALADAAPLQRAPDSLVNLLQHAVHIANTSSNRRILNTALDCLGSYAAWLSSVEGERGESVARECVQAAGAALDRSPATAARALRKLCSDCPVPAAALVADIVNAAKSSEARSEPWVRRQLFAAAGAALAAAQPATAQTLLDDLATSLIKDLQAQAKEPLGSCAGAADGLAALLGALAPRPELGLQLVRSIAYTLPAFTLDQDLIEPLFNVLKQTVSTLMEECSPLLEEIAQLAVLGFKVKPCATGLDFVKLLVLVVGEQWLGMSALLHECLEQTARVIAPDPASMSDLTEGLFALLLAITKKKASYLQWLTDLLPQLVDLGCTCVRLWEACAARAACAWLAALAGHAPSLLHPHAPALIVSVLRCIGGATPRNQIEPLADLLLALNRAPWREGSDHLSLWLGQALAVTGFPTPHATDAHKQKFIAAVLREKTSKRRIQDTVQEFSLVCRGLIGTEYARQTLASRQMVA